MKSFMSKRKVFSWSMFLLGFSVTFLVWKTNSINMIHSCKKTWTRPDSFKTLTPVQNWFNGRTTKIAFLKTPKTGSSTTACIFMKFGLRNNLSVYLDNHSASIAHRDFLLTQNKQYDIFALHTQYSYKFFNHIVDKPVIIAQVRNPVTAFVSRAFYLKENAKRRQESKSDQHFIDSIIKELKTPQHHNIQSHYLSIPEEAYTNIDVMQNILKTLNGEISLVLTLERFDESLVLMKRLLHWSFMDIIYAKKVTGNYNVVLSLEQEDKIRNILYLDNIVYEFFNDILDKKIRREGQDFQQEVKHFQTILSEVSSFCKTNNGSSETLIFHRSPWDEDFTYHRKYCVVTYDWSVATYREYGTDKLKQPELLNKIGMV